MLTWTGWLFALLAAVIATILAAAAGQPMLQMAAVAAVAIAISLLAVRDHQKLKDSGAPASAVASSSARYFALIWAWGALAILITYLFIIEQRWPEWWQFFLGFAFAALASLGFGFMLDRDRASGNDDLTLVKFGRILVKVQVVGMAAGVISLFIDGKFPRPETYADWAGCNIFFFGALAIAAISLDALRSPAYA